MTAIGLKMKPFRINYIVSVLCDEFETVYPQTEDEARDEIRLELQDGFRQIQYDVPWEIVDWSYEEVKPS